MAEAYVFRIDGELSPELLDTFEPVDAVVEGGVTEFTCQVTDGAQLFGLVARCETLGLRLVSLARSRPATV